MTKPVLPRDDPSIDLVEHAERIARLERKVPATAANELPPNLTTLYAIGFTRLQPMSAALARIGWGYLTVSPPLGWPWEWEFLQGFTVGAEGGLGMPMPGWYAVSASCHAEGWATDITASLYVGSNAGYMGNQASSFDFIEPSDGSTDHAGPFVSVAGDMLFPTASPEANGINAYLNLACPLDTDYAPGQDGNRAIDVSTFIRARRLSDI